MNAAVRRPSRWYYALAVLILLVGAAVFVRMLWTGIQGFGAEMQQVVAPGESRVQLLKPGEYIIYYEYQSVIGNRVYSTGEALPPLEVTLREEGTGAEVPILAPSVSSTYTIGSRSGRSVVRFKTEQPGTFVLKTAYLSSSPAPEVVLAVGPGAFGGLVGTILGSMGVLFGAMLASGGVVVVIYLLRRRAV